MFKKLFGNTKKPAAVDSKTSVPDSTAPQIEPKAAEGGSNWFTEKEILSLHEIEDEQQLSKAISGRLPMASREEVFFRFRLGQAIVLRQYELPVLPTSATQVMQLSRNPNAKTSEFVEIIQSDPSLVGAIIAAANSSFFATVVECSSLRDAIVRIGLTEVERTTMLHTMRSKMFKVPGYDALVGELVEHGAEAAVATQIVAEKVGGSASDAFLAGMFHDVGKLIVLQVIGDVQRKLNWKAPRELVDSAFDAFHTKVGELACVSWKFPDPICRAIATHHDAEAAIQSPLSRAVYIANAMTHLQDEEELDELTQDPVCIASRIDRPILESLHVAWRNQMNPEPEPIPA